MKITPVDNINLMELDTIAAMIRIVPWQGELVPHFMLMTREERDDREKVTVMELAALQEGLYQAANKVDEMIHCLFDEIREEKMQEFRDLTQKIEELDRRYYNDDDEDFHEE
tara:strand:- start:405 stop:740 length:336 start_codon:yes stop_codon:yes gene_type:complete